MLYLNKYPVMYGAFPNKESHLDIRELTVRALNRVRWVYEDDKEFFQLALLKDYLDSIMTRTELEVRYMPHSRMDRMNETYATALITASKLVKGMGFLAITVVEPHSDVTPALLNTTFVDQWCIQHLQKVVDFEQVDTLFFPDAGASKRYISSRLPYAIGYKSRDFETGRIIDFNLTGPVGKNVLIVDDLCSKGGTFVHSSKLLRKAGAERVFLLVAHCERTVYTGELFECIDKLYTSIYNLGLIEAHNLILLED